MIKRKINRFVGPSDLVGEWSDYRGTYFWHEKPPVSMKCVIEKTTGTPLRRDPTELTALSYGGATRGGGELQAIWLRFEAVINSRKLYSLIVKRSAPRMWVPREKFFKNSKQTFVCWCAKFELPSGSINWSCASSTMFEQIRQVSIAQEEPRDRVATDDSPVGTSLLEMRKVLSAPHCEKIFFTVHTEMGASFFLDSDGELVSDHLDHAVSSSAVASSLRGFFEWDKRQNLQPHCRTDGDSWTHVVHQLIARNA